jgi:hypothetical protein
MSYNSGRNFSSVYTSSQSPAASGVAPNIDPKYNTLGNYYDKSTSQRKIFVTPAFGGSGYNILQNGIPQTDLTGKYFRLTQAYPCAPSFPFPPRY